MARVGRRRWSRRAGLVLVVAAVVGLLASSALGRTVSARASSHPATDRSPQRNGPSGPLPVIGAGRVVDEDDVGDPYVLRVPAGADGPRAFYVLLYTTDWRSNVPTAVSDDLVHWRRVADALPVLPAWALPNRTMTWAPAAQRVAGGWVLYFSTEDAATRTECIGAAFGRRPTGPYRDTAARPLVCQASAGGSIDPSVVVTAAGTTLVWKREGGSAAHPASIWSQQLSPDGRHLIGRAHRLLVADLPWQHHNVEGPAMLADRHGGWWLFYAGDSWRSTTYDTGVAWCASTAGPCREADRSPLLRGRPGADSPGGFDTFVAADGRLMASWSVFPADPANPQQAEAMDRDLVIAPVLAH